MDANRSRELIAAEHARRAAITRGDTDALEEILADTFYYAHINGAVETREAYLAHAAHQPRTIRFTNARDLVVQPRPGYFLLSGISRIEATMMTIETLFFSVWERGAQGWKISAYVSTPLPGVKYPFLGA